MLQLNIRNKYITDDASDSNDSLEEAQGDFGRSLQDIEKDPSKLIDLELINLLKYCYTLSDLRNSDSYQDEMLNKSIELGRQN